MDNNYVQLANLEVANNHQGLFPEWLALIDEFDYNTKQGKKEIENFINSNGIVVPLNESSFGDIPDKFVGELLFSVKEDWGGDSDLFYAVESSIMSDSLKNVKKTLENYEVLEDYEGLFKKHKISLSESKTNETIVPKKRLSDLDGINLYEAKKDILLNLKGKKMLSDFSENSLKVYNKLKPNQGLTTENLNERMGMVINGKKLNEESKSYFYPYDEKMISFYDKSKEIKKLKVFSQMGGGRDTEIYGEDADKAKAILSKAGFKPIDMSESVNSSTSKLTDADLIEFESNFSSSPNKETQKIVNKLTGQSIYKIDDDKFRLVEKIIENESSPVRALREIIQIFEGNGNNVKLNESKSEQSDLVFTDPKEAKEWLDWIGGGADGEDWTDKIIIDDMGIKKYSSDTGGHYFRVKTGGLIEFYGTGYESAIKGDFKSAIFS